MRSQLLCVGFDGASLFFESFLTLIVLLSFWFFVTWWCVCAVCNSGMRIEFCFWVRDFVYNLQEHIL